MSPSMLLPNLLPYSLQIALLIACAAVFAPRPPKLRLLHWQATLVFCLLLPMLQTWHRDSAPDPSLVSIDTRSTVAAAPLPAPVVIPWNAILAGGVALFLLRLALGAFRVHLYCRKSRLLWTRDSVEFRVSDDIPGAVTYGLRRPVVLLPPTFLDLPPELQSAIEAHELTHIRRHDWLFALGEEIVRAVFWFHPAIWFALSRIDTAREQLVDSEAVRITGNRDAYLDALLAVAGFRPENTLGPEGQFAPSFLKKRHLAERVALLLKEVTMTRQRMLLSAAASTCSILLTAALAAQLLPLRAPAQESPGRVISRTNPRYPPQAKLKGIEGTVNLEVGIDERGQVFDARVLDGPIELRRAALESVLTWQFTPSDKRVFTNIALNFRLQDDANVPPTILNRIEYDASIPEKQQAYITPRLPVRPGDRLAAGASIDIRRAVAEIDPQLTAALTADGALQIAPAKAVRVGGNLQSAKLRKKVAPVYPQEAKASGIQGVVRLNVQIDAEGKVLKADLVSGHPLLVSPSVEAVRQWEWEPTLLNGNPVDVITQVDINYALAP